MRQESEPGYGWKTEEYLGQQNGPYKWVEILDCKQTIIAFL